ncbi:MAG: hypothetical protein ACREQJ_12255, partial [Candidatus Binatia bacterium]
YAYNALGVAELAAANPEAATAALEQALQISRDVRAGQETAIFTLAHLAEVMLARGDAARAREHVAQAVREASEHHVPTSECFVRIVEARVFLAEGDVTRAASSLDRSLALVESTGARCFEPFARVERARLGDDGELREGELRRARELFAEIGASERVRAIAG